MSPKIVESSRAARNIKGSMFDILIVMLIGMLIGACGSGGGSHKSNSSTIEDTPNPTVENSPAGAPTLLATTSFDLSTVGYEQHEFFISGKARSFQSEAPMSSDGKLTASVADSADYKTRILVNRPIDASAFNGTVVIEWLNVSSTTDAASEWIMTHTELVRNGYAWVGVSAQKAGIDGGGPDISVTGLPLHLKALNAARYESLVHPGDNYAFDIYSQAAKSILNPSAISPLQGLDIERAIAAGESQSADFLVTYVNAIAPLAKIFDGYFIHSRFHGTVGLAPGLYGSSSAGIDFAARSVVHIRDDLDVPVMMVQTETDLLKLFFHLDRQADSDNFRLWEIAGSSHADLYVVQTGASDHGLDPNVAAIPEISTPNPLITCDQPINAGPQHFVVKAAIAALDNWLRNGVPPASANPIEIAGDTFVKDSYGNVLGGVRTPYLNVPIATLSGEGQTGNTFCRLFGTTRLFDATQLAGLYPDHESYVSQVNTSTDGAVASGFLLQSDGDLIETWAQASGVGTP